MREHGVGGAMGLAGGRFADPDIDALFGGVGEDEVLAIGVPAGVAILNKPGKSIQKFIERVRFRNKGVVE